MLMEMKNVSAVIEYDSVLEAITLIIEGKGMYEIEAREVETVERVLDTLRIPYQEKLGDLLSESHMMMEQYRKDKLYQLGYDAGKQFMEDKIEKHSELGKPVLCNGELYFFKNARENLFDIMDDLDADSKK